MTISSEIFANREAVEAARDHALARGELGAVSVDPDAEARQHLRALGRISNGPAVAEALIAVVGAGVVPLDRATLVATADAFAGYTEAAQHFQQRPYDGVGLLLGEQPDGSVRLAVRASPAAWGAWLAEHGVEVRQQIGDDGRVVGETKSYKDIGRHCRVHWSPPGVAARSTSAVVGRAQIEAEGRRVRSDRSGEDEVGWVAWSVGFAWSVGGEAGKRLAFASRTLAPGVKLLGDGVLPMAASRSDGWSLVATTVPPTLEPAEFPEWLVTELGGKLVKA